MSRLTIEQYQKIVVAQAKQITELNSKAVAKATYDQIKKLKAQNSKLRARVSYLTKENTFLHTQLFEAITPKPATVTIQEPEANSGLSLPIGAYNV